MRKIMKFRKRKINLKKIKEKLTILDKLYMKSQNKI